MKFPKNINGSGYLVSGSSEGKTSVQVFDSLTPEECRELAKWLLAISKEGAKNRGQTKRWWTIHNKRMKNDKKYRDRMHAALT